MMARCSPWRAPRRITRFFQIASVPCSTVKCLQGAAPLPPICDLNPLLIVEVLSPSTEGYDRGKKFELYRTIGSFQEYLIVHQDRRHVEHYSKQDDGSWLLREHTGAGGSVSIARLEAEIPLADLYASALGID
jgi:Uma2 family endonuclease